MLGTQRRRNEEWSVWIARPEKFGGLGIPSIHMASNQGAPLPWPPLTLIGALPLGQNEWRSSLECSKAFGLRPHPEKNVWKSPGIDVWHLQILVLLRLKLRISKRINDTLFPKCFGFNVDAFQEKNNSFAKYKYFRKIGFTPPYFSNMYRCTV